MIYKCPLCLETLTDETELVRVCREHPPKENEQPVPFKCSEENLKHSIFCSKGGWCNDNIESGVFLRHIGCQAKNPFWNDVKGMVELPGSDNVTNFDYTTENGSLITLQVNHWEIGMLRRMPAAEEMWFPMMLLRAMGKGLDDNDGQKLGALVGLMGNIRVGKSVIAMQAMEYKGYIAPNGKQGHIEVRGFLFSRMQPGTKVSATPFLADLYINNLMTMNKRGIFPLPGTDRLPGNIKVAFIKPTDNVVAMFPDKSPPVKINPERKGGQRGLVRRIVTSFKDIFRGVKEVLAENNHDSFWYTVAFYDPSGEAFAYGDSIPDEIERSADKIAIVVDGTEIFGLAENNGIEPSSMAVANDRIRKVHDKRLKGSLVVTKLDVVLNKLSEPERKQVRDIAENLEGDPEEAREMLAKWLSQLQHDDSAKELLQRLDLVERVFFVWTEDLPVVTNTGEVRSSPTQPHSYGLAKFICWCLDKDWTHIVHMK